MNRFIDLFSGIGGFHVALRKQGLDCVFASEIDSDASAVYQENFGHTPAGDICQVPTDRIPEHDILCAGFPCQPFSRSGKGMGLADDRGRLYYEIVRIAKHHKPKLMLLENVKAILTIDGGNVRNEIYQTLEKIGYRVEHSALNASHFGVPQKRERVYFVAIRKDVPLRFTQPEKTMHPKYIKDVLLPDSRTKDLVVSRNDIKFDKPREQEPALRPIRIGLLNKGGQGERIYSDQGHAVTLSANGGGAGHRTGLYLVNNKVRRLHLDEAKQVMGFDRNHIVSPGLQGYKQLGNAVIPSMITQIHKNVHVR